MGAWKCFVEISGDTGMIINDNFPLNEALSRRPDFQLSIQQEQQPQQQQRQNEEAASSSSSTNIRFSQSGALNKNKVAAWH
jgi:hypothetical protein